MRSGPAANVHALQAPSENGGILCHPESTLVGDLLRQNHARLSAAPPILGRSLLDLRRATRHDVLAAAARYLSEAGEPLPSLEGATLLVAGHQPDLVHPGVWLKHFALNAFARRHSAIPLNLIVDNDTAKKTSLSLPSGDRVAHVPFDRWTSEIPFEERHVLEEPLFQSLPERVSQYIRTWPFKPLFADYWRAVQKQATRTPLLGERFAAARRNFERQWGCHNPEVPLSRACDSTAFAWFAMHLLSELPRLHRVYNGAVAGYRARYGLRNRQHPVPDLARDGDWLEAPFWAWRAGQERRGKLWVRTAGTRIEVRAGNSTTASLAVKAPAEDLVAQWLTLRQSGIKIRTRALTTTLFARVFLGDLFLHGLGGGKYDEVTDTIIRDFYGIEPPAFLVVTGTLRLPLPMSKANEADLSRIQRLRRDVWWNPQRHLAEGVALDLRREKQRWIERAVDEAERRDRFAALREVTGELRNLVRDRWQNLTRDEERVRRELGENAVAARRDYAFLLHPEEKLRPFLHSCA